MGGGNEYPWAWSPGHMDEWSLQLTAEQHLASSTIRSYQCSLRQFTEFLIDGRYGWAVACEQAFGPGRHPVAIAHEWNTIAHLNDYEGNPEARPFTREELQRFLDYADEQVEQAVKSKRKGALACAVPKPVAWRVSWPFGGAELGHNRGDSDAVRLSPRRGIPGT
jgi:integrase/recombinase XerC